MRTSYRIDDVQVLLTDITGLVEPEDTKTRERKIQSGTHYCEMLPQEYVPTKEYEQAYHEMLELYAKEVGLAVSILAEKLYAAGKTVLVSLARAGIPAGILVKHYLRAKYEIDVEHYAISIIRGRGIDKNAMDYILSQHYPSRLVFIDGWTGKGAIRHQLDEALMEYPQVDGILGVIADPAGVAEIFGTQDDLMIPSACLNSTVSGLMSRTFLRSDIIGPKDYHGAVYYGEMAPYDQSYAFINRIEKEFVFDAVISVEKKRNTSMHDVARLMQEYHITDVNLVKPGIGESTRVLLRRVPDVIVINEAYKDAVDLKPIYRLCEEKGVPIAYQPLENYKVCGIIKQLADA